METETIERGLEERINDVRKLDWTACGPDLTPFVEYDDNERIMVELIRQHGETRFRYAAHLTDALGLSGDPKRWLRMIDHACKEGWLSAHTMQRMAFILQERLWPQRLQRIPIPWLKRHVPKATPEQAQFIEETCATVLPAARQYPLRELFKPDLLMESAARVDVTLDPDLRLESVIAWLCFVVEGAEDPQLRRAHANYQPHKNLKGFPAYQKAWRTILG